MSSDNSNTTSLNKYISESGVCSRREADKIIDAQRVTINGNIAKKGNRVAAGDIVEIDGKPLREKEAPIYDKFSQGLIFLTNDGDIVNKILRAGNRHEKEYLVTVNKPVTNSFIQNMAKLWLPRYEIDSTTNHAYQIGKFARRKMARFY